MTESISYTNWERARQTGNFVVEDYTDEETEAWMTSLNLPPRLAGETWHEWAQRTGERPFETDGSIVEVECLLSKTKGMFGDTGEKLGSTVGYTIRTESPMEFMDKKTGQIIEHCQVEGCAAELEVYPDSHTPNIYQVSGESLQTGRFVCKLAKERV